MLRESVRICVHNPQMCVLMRFRLNVCRRVHRHAGVLFIYFIIIFFLCTSKGSSPHFLRVFTLSYAEASVRFRILRVPAGVSLFVGVHARLRALQQHAIMMSNGSCSLFNLQRLFPPLYASCLPQRSLASHRHHISQG